MSITILGEYDCVARQSANPDRLRLSHQTPCDAPTAYFLIAVMHEKYFPGQTAPKVKLRKPVKGKNSARGWGGRRAQFDDEGNFTSYRGYLSLPETPLSSFDTIPNGKLRMGLVFHEYAHVIEMLKFGTSDHGARFTMILDTLLYEMQEYWIPKSRQAAEVK